MSNFSDALLPMPASYVPQGATGSDLWLERFNLDGAVLGGVAYGVHLSVFSACAYYLLCRPRSHRQVLRRNLYLLAIVFTLFLLGTLNVACNVKLTEDAFVNGRTYPGGPVAWLFAHYAGPVSTAGTAAYVGANFISVGLLLWRTYVVWNSWPVIVLPTLIYLGFTAMATLTLLQAAQPSADLWTHTTVQFTLPYLSLSNPVLLNATLTLLIVARLLYMRRRLRQTLGRGQEGPYTSVAAMLVESAAPCTIAGLVFIITYARESNAQNLVLPVFSQIMCIDPQLVMLRVLMARETNDTTLSVHAAAPRRGANTTLDFAVPSGIDTSLGGDTPSIHDESKTSARDESRFGLSEVGEHESNGVA